MRIIFYTEEKSFFCLYMLSFVILRKKMQLAKSQYKHVKKINKSVISIKNVQLVNLYCIWMVTMDMAID